LSWAAPGCGGFAALIAVAHSAVSRPYLEKANFTANATVTHRMGADRVLGPRDGLAFPRYMNVSISFTAAVNLVACKLNDEGTATS
jgi:hypothetical protein